MVPRDPETEGLLAGVRSGDRAAVDRLLERHRDRLRQMVVVRMDQRLSARIDPSDIVQETLAVAARKLPRYLHEPAVSFYPWLRRIAWERLVKLHQKHLKAQRRTVTREEPQGPSLSSESAMDLAKRLMDSGTSPSLSVEKKELRGQVQAALTRLRASDREILVMRYLEQLSNKEIAEALGITEGALKMRHLRALTALKTILAQSMKEDQ